MISNKGFTLVELLVATVIGVILVGVVGSLLNTQLGIVTRQSAIIQSSTQNKLGLDVMVREIRESAGVAVSCCSSPAETSGTNVLVLQFWPLDSNKDPIIGGSNYDYIIYKKVVNPQNVGQLIRRVVPYSGPPASYRPASTKIIVSDVASLVFTYTPSTPNPSVATKVDVALGTSTKQGNKTFPTNQSATALIRNK